MSIDPLTTKPIRSQTIIGQKPPVVIKISPIPVRRVPSDPTRVLHRLQLDGVRVATMSDLPGLPKVTAVVEETFERKEQQLKNVAARFELFRQECEKLNDPKMRLHLCYSASGSFVKAYKLEKKGRSEAPIGVDLAFKGLLKEIVSVKSFILLMQWAMLIEMIEKSIWLHEQKSNLTELPPWLLNLKKETEIYLQEHKPKGLIFDLERSKTAVGEDTQPILNRLKSYLTKINDSKSELLLSLKKDIENAIESLEFRRSLITADRLKGFLLGTFPDIAYDRVIEDNLGWTFKPSDFIHPLELAIRDLKKHPDWHDQLLIKSLILAKQFKTYTQVGEKWWEQTDPLLLPLIENLLSITDPVIYFEARLIAQEIISKEWKSPLMDFNLQSVKNPINLLEISKSQLREWVALVVKDLRHYAERVHLSINSKEFKFAGKPIEIQKIYSPNLFRVTDFLNCIATFATKVQFNSEKLKSSFLVELVDQLIQDSNYGVAFGFHIAIQQNEVEQIFNKTKLKEKIASFHAFFKSSPIRMFEKNEKGNMAIPDIMSFRRIFALLTEEVPSNVEGMVNGIKMEKIQHTLEQFQESQREILLKHDRNYKYQTNVLQLILPPTRT